MHRFKHSALMFPIEHKEFWIEVEGVKRGIGRCELEGNT